MTNYSCYFSCSFPPCKQKQQRNDMELTLITGASKAKAGLPGEDHHDVCVR
jgi:hypothetical protein